MNNIDIILGILIVVFFVLVIRHFIKPKHDIKPNHVKKEEIIADYEQQMYNLLEKYKEDEKLLKEQKMILLKHISVELHKNIFFDEEEIKIIIQHLASL